MHSCCKMIIGTGLHFGDRTRNPRQMMALDSNCFHVLISAYEARADNMDRTKSSNLGASNRIDCCNQFLTAMIARAITLICLVTTLAVSTALKAQSFYGSIVGTVRDTSGAVVQDATVKVTNIGTNRVQSVRSDAVGQYSIPGLVPASYNVEVTKAGFKRFLSVQVTVGVAAIVRVDPLLVVGAASETVKVTAEEPLLQTDTSGVSQEIEGAQVRELPLWPWMAPPIW